MGTREAGTEAAGAGADGEVINYLMAARINNLATCKGGVDLADWRLFLKVEHVASTCVMRHRQRGRGWFGWGCRGYQLLDVSQNQQLSRF